MPVKLHVREKDWYTLIEQSMLCSNYSPIDLLVIVCCINKLKLMSNNSYILYYCKVVAVYSVVE